MALRAKASNESRALRSRDREGADAAHKACASSTFNGAQYKTNRKEKPYGAATVSENRWPCGPKLRMKVEPYGAATVRERMPDTRPRTRPAPPRLSTVRMPHTRNAHNVTFTVLNSGIAADSKSLTNWKPFQPGPETTLSHPTVRQIVSSPSTPAENVKRHIHTTTKNIFPFSPDTYPPLALPHPVSIPDLGTR
jgi:hypothetical protein